jgi:hypothetical protein
MTVSALASDRVPAHLLGARRDWRGFHCKSFDGHAERKFKPRPSRHAISASARLAAYAKSRLNSSAGGILNRSNPWGEFSPSSPEAALYTSITLVHLDFGEWGNVIGERRGKAYTAFTYDPDFSQYVSTQSE